MRPTEKAWLLKYGFTSPSRLKPISSNAPDTKSMASANRLDKVAEGFFCDGTEEMEGSIDMDGSSEMEGIRLGTVD